MAILTVVEQAYRATLEEQDDTVLWITHMMKNAGGSFSILLRGNAVNYAVKGQDASGLKIGGVPLSAPPTLDRDLEQLMEGGVAVHVVQEHLAERGIRNDELVKGVQMVSQNRLAQLFDEHEAVWYW